MGSGRFLFSFLLLGLTLNALSQSVLKIVPGDPGPDASDSGDDGFCHRWRFAVENNDAGSWKTVPRRCARFVERYMTGEGYLSDSKVVAADSLAFAKAVSVAGDGKDAWVFDIDETLLSNFAYYEAHGFGSETFDERAYDEWVAKAKAPALPPSLDLYNELKQMGFTVFLLTGRSESQRNATAKNLLSAGYTNWDELILRGASDRGRPANSYKSEKRKEIEDAGYRIHGSSGDQWSDLLGFSQATRSFKLPNPMYYIG